MNNYESKSKRMKSSIWVRIWKLLNVLIQTGLFSVCWYQYYADQILIPFFSRGNWVVVVLFLLFYLTFGRVYSGFSISLQRIRDITLSQWLSLVLTNLFLYIVICLLCRRFVTPLPLLITLAAQMLVSMVWSFLARRIYYIRFKPAKTVVVWGERRGIESMIERYALGVRFDVCKSVSVDECMQDLRGVLQGAEVVFLYGIQSEARNAIVQYCVGKDLRVYVLPCVGDLLMQSAQTVNMMHLPIFMVERHNPRPEYLLIKRAFDLLASVLALAVLSPLIGVVALLVKRDGGPAFYRQKRLTKDGKIFELVKFRSMRVDAEKDGVARLSTGTNDDRVTPVGRWIRRFRVDEIPQFFNVLRGDLSIVGPRPERPEIAAQYEKELPEFALRLQVKAGITGYAQVNGKYNTEAQDKLLMDLYYISKAGIRQDLQIMLATAKILFQPESTEGIEEGKTTALKKETRPVGV